MSVYSSKYHDGYYARCDVCGYIQTDKRWEKCDDRACVWEDMLKMGWKFRKKNGKWVHFCPRCVEAMQDAKREEEAKRRRAFFGNGERDGDTDE